MYANTKMVNEETIMTLQFPVGRSIDPVVFLDMFEEWFKQLPNKDHEYIQTIKHNQKVKEES